jgi:superfamily II DNA/RNA helicase
MVINCNVTDLPTGGSDYQTYLYRTSRTGRFGRTGTALTFGHNRKSCSLRTDICKALQHQDLQAGDERLGLFLMLSSYINRE